MLTFEPRCAWLAVVALILAASLPAHFSGCADAAKESPDAVEKYPGKKWQKIPKGSVPAPPRKN